MSQHPAPNRPNHGAPAADALRQAEPEPAGGAPDVQLTRDAERGTRGAAQADPQLPHERDQHPDSQAAPEAPNKAVGEQAFRDVSHGLVDTDESLRKSAVDKRDGQHAQPAGQVTPPRQATLDAPAGRKG